MEFGNKIRALRLQRGVTQEALAEQLNVTPQAVSKWEREAALPDIQLLPAISACFGVTIDELFDLSDDTRMERIQNMLWDERVLDRAAVERDVAFLLEKARREPDNGRPYELLADLHNHLAREHRAKAADCARQALTRDPDRKGAHSELVEAMGGKAADWHVANHKKLIDWYKGFLEKNPGHRGGYLWLLDQLIDDDRLDEARDYLAEYEKLDDSFRGPLYRGLIRWRAGDHDGAMAVWEDMCRRWPEDWLVWFSMGDAMARMGRYDQALAHYRQCLMFQPKPRYVDPWEAMAQVCEIQRDWAGAVQALEEELEVLSQDWNTITGETADKVRREIAWLQARQFAH